MQAFRIRRAQAEDMENVFSLIQGLASYEKAPHAVSIEAMQLKTWGFGSQPAFVCWVAEIEHEVVGFLLAYHRFSTWKGPTLYIEDVFVVPASRQQGMGFALFRAAAEYALAQEMALMQWQVLDWNAPALSFYKKLGAEEDASWINMTLPPKTLLP